MICKECGKKAIMNGFCKEHFMVYFEKTFYETIERFNLIEKDDKVVVAASGGKDSTTLLHLLSQKWKVEALAVDEGIHNYRPKSLEYLKKFTKERGIKLKIVSFEEEFGMSLDRIVKLFSDRPACSFCGIFRRYLLNKYSKGYDKIATGHNLDDEAQSIIMNFFKNNIEILQRLGPKSEKKKGFVQRIKPLYLLTEKEVAVYSFYNFNIEFSECPYAFDAFRNKIRTLLNEIEVQKPGTKRRIVERFLKIRKKLKDKEKVEELNECRICGEPTDKDICKACRLVEEIKLKVKNEVLHS